MQKKTGELYRRMIDLAKQAMQSAYTPYSKFNVGAAVLTQDGQIYSGCNIENASYGATNCAERTAIFKAVSEGHRQIDKIAIVSSSGDVTYPCGICRQVMIEFMPQGEVIFENKQGELLVYPIEEVLPLVFDATVLDD